MSAAFKVLSKRIALGLQYDGSSFSGWQSQLSGNTVQDHLEQALTRFIAADNAAMPLRVTAAGRTDTGVHALGQVIHVDVTVERDAWSWVRGLNRYLPQAIVVNWAQQVANTFDARFSAYERTYLYALHAGPCRAPTVAQRAGYLMLPAQEWFDVAAMQAAAASLIGEHDFSAFRAAECQSKTPVKHLYEITILDQEPWLFFKIRANAFLHHMVRNLVGSLLAVGLGKQSSAWLAAVLASQNRQIAAPTFSADGLYLMEVKYPQEFAIPQPWLSHSWIPYDVLEALAFHPAKPQEAYP
jgi:tRNA pseudouridine38-40 synthase